MCEALAWRADELNAGGGVKATLQTAGMEQRLSRDLELTLYRVAQEALTNVARHSQARSAQVTLRQGNGRVTLIIEDDGAGFDAEAKLAHPSGLGLAGMRERLALVGGSLQVRSVPGSGTHVIASVPAVS